MDGNIDRIRPTADGEYDGEASEGSGMNVDPKYEWFLPHISRY